MFLVEFFALSIQRKAFHVEVVQKFSDLQFPGRVVYLPGNEPDSLVCVVPDKTYAKPNKNYNSTNIFKGYEGKCHRILFMPNTLLFCFKGKSYFNQVFLGEFSHFELKDNFLYYHTKEGDLCENNMTWNLRAQIECDPTVPLGTVSISSFWNMSSCTIGAALKSREACAIPELNTQEHRLIKCISKQLYQREKPKK